MSCRVKLELEGKSTSTIFIFISTTPIDSDPKREKWDGRKAVVEIELTQPGGRGWRDAPALDSPSVIDEMEIELVGIGIGLGEGME